MRDKSKQEHIGYAYEHPLRSDIYILQSLSQFEYGNDCVSDVTMALPHTTRQLFNNLSVQVWDTQTFQQTHTSDNTFVRPFAAQRPDYLKGARGLV